MSENSLLEKLQHLVTRFEEVGTLITDPEVIADMDRYVKLNKEYSDLQKIVDVRNEYKSALDGIDEAKEILRTNRCRPAGISSRRTFNKYGKLPILKKNKIPARSS